MADGEESGANDEVGDEAGARPGRRHDAGSAAEAVDDHTDPESVSDHGSAERKQDSAKRVAEVANAGEAVAEVEEILDGEFDDRQLERIISEQHWEGPLPPPAALAAYEAVLPGAANRAFTLAERNMDLKHVRAETVRAAVDGEVAVNTITAEADRDALKRGQYLAAGISGLIGVLSFAGLFLTPWAAVGFTVPLAQVAAALIRTVSDRQTPEARRDRDEPSSRADTEPSHS